MTLNIENAISLMCPSCKNYANFSVYTRMKISICSFLHDIFIISVKEEGQDDRRL
jgi:hypothetical protein